VARQAVSPVTAVVPAAVIGAAGAVLLAWPARDNMPGSWWRRASVLPGWSTGRLWRLTLLTCSAVAACDAAGGPHLILIFATTAQYVLLAALAAAGAAATAGAAILQRQHP
jgi:hypothetical protein